jgi:hypothetical protein
MNTESTPTATLTLTLTTANGKISETIHGLEPHAARTLFDTTRTASKKIMTWREALAYSLALARLIVYALGVDALTAHLGYLP